MRPSPLRLGALPAHGHRCGSAHCRRTVTGDDWQLPELQRRYGDHWTPALIHASG